MESLSPQKDVENKAQEHAKSDEVIKSTIDKKDYNWKS